MNKTTHFKSNSIIGILSIVICLSTQSKAQTITFYNQNPSYGDDILYEIVDVDQFGFCFDPVGSGSINDKTWDTRSCPNTETIHQSKGLQHVVFNNPSTTPYATDFPLANFAISYSGVEATDGYEYYRYANDSITRFGFTDLTGLQLWYSSERFQNAFPRYLFPISPGESWSSTYTGGYKSLGMGEDSVKVENGIYSAEAIATGTLILPPLNPDSEGEVFNDVVLIKITESFEINSYVFGTTLNVLTINEDYYAWYKDSIQEPLLIYYETEENTSGIGGGITNIVKMKYQPIDGNSLPLSISTSKIKQNELFHIYPNPTENTINIDLTRENPSNISIKVINVLGEEIYTINRPNKLNQIDLSAFNAGVYFVRISSSQKEFCEKIILK